MQFESPISTRLRTSQTHAGNIISVRAKKEPFVMLFMSVWLCGWTFGGVTAGSVLLTGGGDLDGRLFLSFWMMGWAVGWVLVTSSLLWMLAGQESLTVSRTHVTKTVSIPLINWSWHYNPALMTKTRRNVVPSTRYGRNQLNNPLGKQGRVAFDYGQKTVTFGAGLDDAEADFVLDSLKSGLGLRREAA
ncbi:hypothetical protein [Labrenzia sp. VG12]|uniref:hypothetical protein n=1 Tax=Labrenzia sp. VG12 TaxID=2021862 RepID=UPI000B8C4A49|nr:hypothetical protein [Labrenzia sp. VG12]ASP32868.1 hypothetical protein CHH27_06085 [Labrenzia sp. VG12]